MEEACNLLLFVLGKNVKSVKDHVCYDTWKILSISIRCNFYKTVVNFLIEVLCSDIFIQNYFTKIILKE